ncbi:MAG: hypothetical protein M0R06_00895 [Sphaerochaeta sp.]|jgi:hypothetical protein|nr:hypothetical protein [Sphaerochaeta sp.]
MVLKSDELIEKVLPSVYSWAKQKGYEPIKKDRSVTMMKGTSMLKVEIKDGEVVYGKNGDYADDLQREVVELLGIKPSSFEDEPVDMRPEVTVPAVVENTVPEKKPKARAPTPKQQSEAKEEWDEYAKKKETGYRISGRTELSAFGVSKIMNQAGLCSEVIKCIRNENVICAMVRVIDPKTGHYREDAKVIDRETFWTMKAIDTAASQEKARPGFIIGFNEDTGRPIVNPERTVNGMPAQLWMVQQLTHSWHTADGLAVTGAERRAALKMLNREWRDDDELQHELDEAAAIEPAK